MLRAAGAPSKGGTVASGIRLMHGTLWHEWFHQTLIKYQIPFFHELRLDKYMPEGWGGTADWVFWSPEHQAFVLADLKTTKGEAIYWLNKDGAKVEHIWQVSAYFHALVAMGLPMVKGFGVMYWPMNDTSDGTTILPSLQECEPLPEDVVRGRMEDRWNAVQNYLKSGPWPASNVASAVSHPDIKAPLDAFITDELAPEQERVQKLVWNKLQDVFDLKLVPHWSAAFCDYEPPLCACSTLGTTKIGHYTLDGEFVHRKDYEDVIPVVRPTLSQLSSRRNGA